MEIVMQWLDDIDDLIAALGLVSERIRNFCIAVSLFSVSLAVQVCGVFLALRHPPLAMAFAMILFVMLLYRSVTGPHAALHQPI
jgi:ABC-type enterobactin transport system permease subunit